jgi:murein L,D-transpeptidase YafK
LRYLAKLCAIAAVAATAALWSGGQAHSRLPAPAAEQATEVVVLKSERRLILRRGDAEIAAYAISLGFTPEGHKRREGDGRTPEGRYVIDWRNPASAYHLSLHISYPNAADEAAARTDGHAPGGMIMIHGLPNGKAWVGEGHRLIDWTDGCIAVTSEEIEEIWSLVPDGTPIEILP